MVATALIIDGLRSPRGRGRPEGGLHGLHPQELLAEVLRPLADRTGIEVGDVDDVLMGNGSNSGEHANDIARMAVLTAGWPVTVPGLTMNRFCGSGQQAVMNAAMGIAAGWHDLVVAGGVESMSRYGRESVVAMDAGNMRLRERHPLVPQGISADLIATREGFDREACDRFAVCSQERAADAMEEGRFEQSVLPIHGYNGDVILDVDEHPRPLTTVESLSELPPAFARSGRKPRDPDGRSYDEMALSRYPDVPAIDHVHHAGNSSGVVDGAAALVLASEVYSKAYGLIPRARVLAGAVAAAEPIIMLTAPGPASLACLEKADMTTEDIDLWEINEAFAAVPMKVIRDLDLDPEKVNVNGGAIALGHPIGATGAILVQTVLDELERRDLSTGLVTMCTGGGMGTATIIERI